MSCSPHIALGLAPILPQIHKKIQIFSPLSRFSCYGGGPWSARSMGRGPRLSGVTDWTTTREETLANDMTVRDRAEQKEEPLSSSGPRGPMPSEAKQLARALAELSATRKTILMYPPGHAQIQQSIDRARTTWDEILSSRPEMTVGTDKDGLLVGRDSFKLKDEISKEFSSILRDHDLAVVHFRRGLSSEELAAFLGVIAEDPEKIRC